tara:strand:+ start:1567 stop:2274 length:708 start_codon:yes stop_codon:yes gene_type:complete
MANINKTFLFPVPSVWHGQDQDDAQVGVETYVGPKNLSVILKLDSDGNKTSEIFEVYDTNGFEFPAPPIDTYVVNLDADVYPIHAAALFGGVSAPKRLEVVAGPSTEPNPKIQDPLHFHEVYDMRSFTYDPTLNSGAGGWSTPKFANQVSSPDDPDDFSFGWEWVRDTRNQLLAASDSKIAEDMPESIKDRWKMYRQKLRELPTEWAGIGTATHLVVWPVSPEEQDNPNFVQVPD